jgi:hypothetical protein
MLLVLSLGYGTDGGMTGIGNDVDYRQPFCWSDYRFVSPPQFLADQRYFNEKVLDGTEC